MKSNRLTLAESFTLESGLTITKPDISFTTYGELNKKADNAIVLCHHLTGNHIPYDANKKNNGWWNEIIGPKKAIDINKYFVVCSNVLGSCHGTTGPSSINKDTGQFYGMNFPAVTIRDMVSLQEILTRNLGIRKIQCVIGPSLGGMLAMEWGLMFSHYVNKVICLGAPLIQSSWAISWNDIAYLAIINDPSWNNGIYSSQPKNGLKLSRYPFLLTCSNPKKINLFQVNNSNPSKYIQHLTHSVQKELNKSADDFTHDANSILYLINAVNGHNIYRSRNDLKNRIDSSNVEFNFIGVSSDIIYPARDIMASLSDFRNAYYFTFDTPFGHNGLLIDQKRVELFIRKIL